MMKGITRKTAVFAVALFVVAASLLSEGKAHGKMKQRLINFVAPFLMCKTETANQCGDNTLAGSDPLTFGEQFISARTGDIEVTVEGAAANKTYDVFYISTPGASFPIDCTSFVGSFKTDKDGDGELAVKGFFPPGDVDSAQSLITDHDTDTSCTTPTTPNSCKQNCAATFARQFITGYKIKK